MNLKHYYWYFESALPSRLCDDIVKLKAFCSICKNGTPGIFSKRLSDKKEQVLVGSDGDYIAVCRECYLK